MTDNKFSVNSGRDEHGEDRADLAVDERLRRALEPTERTVIRIVNAALEADLIGAGRVRSNRRYVPAAVVAALLLAAVVVGLRWPRPAPPASSLRGVVTNEGDIIVVRMAGQPTTFISPGADDSSVPPGTVSIVLLGESK